MYSQSLARPALAFCPLFPPLHPSRYASSLPTEAAHLDMHLKPASSNFHPHLGLCHLLALEKPGGCVAAEMSELSATFPECGAGAQASQQTFAFERIKLVPQTVLGPLHPCSSPCFSPEHPAHIDMTVHVSFSEHPDNWGYVLFISSSVHFSVYLFIYPSPFHISQELPLCQTLSRALGTYSCTTSGPCPPGAPSPVGVASRRPGIRTPCNGSYEVGRRHSFQVCLLQGRDVSSLYSGLISEGTSSSSAESMASGRNPLTSRYHGPPVFQGITEA